MAEKQNEHLERGNGLKSLVKKLVGIISPPGYEAAIRDVIRLEVKPLSDAVHVDALGNLIARKGELGKNGRKIMLTAHMDEIGLIATHVDKNGFIRFTTLGSIQPQVLAGAQVRFLNGIEGVVGLQTFSRISELTPVEKMFIDVGATNSGNCPVKVGDVAAFKGGYLDLGRRLVARSMDGRVGAAVLIETMRRLKGTTDEVNFIFTTQAEVGARGMAPAAYGVDPEIGITVNATPASDTPDDPRLGTALGKGPVIQVKDGRMVAAPQIVDWMVHTAEKNRIPYQREVLSLGSTEAHVMQLTRLGVLSGMLAIPCRYLHSASEMVDIEDVHNAVHLLVALLESHLKL